MGVAGLWRLLEAAGRPVPLDTLDSKVLAVDISIWLHQMVKGYQDARGDAMPNAHLLGLFQRLCKLLYYRIKPVFVFDGGFPELKKETIAKRQDSKAKLNSESERLKHEILLLLGKKSAIGSVLGKQTSPKKVTKQDSVQNSDDLFKLPPLEKSLEEHSSESGSEEDSSSSSVVDLHSVDINSDNFKSLPLREKHDLLLELKETRKMNSWGKLHELPKNSDHFSDFQMNRLLKRRKVQECLEETEKEIGGNTMSLNELESLLNEEGICTNVDSLPTKRIASNENTRFIMINNVKQALEDARKRELAKNDIENTKEKSEDNSCKEASNSDSKIEELDDDLQKAIQMSLECTDDADISRKETESSPDSTFMLDSEYSETSEEEYGDIEFSSAKAYIAEYSDFTSKTINKILSASNKQSKETHKAITVDQILEELDKEVPCTSITLLDDTIAEDVDNKQKSISLSSSEDDDVIEVKSVKDSTSEVVVKSPEKYVVLDSTVEESPAIISKIISVQKTKKDEDVQLDDKDVLTDNQEISDGTDDDFEEVPEEQSGKPVVQITLDLKDTIEDDIFADIFEMPTAEIKTEKEPIVIIDNNQTEHARSVLLEDRIHFGCIEDESDDLQQAIQLSIVSNEKPAQSTIKKTISFVSCEQQTIIEKNILPLNVLKLNDQPISNEQQRIENVELNRDFSRVAETIIRDREEVPKVNTENQADEFKYATEEVEKPGIDDEKQETTGISEDCPKENTERPTVPANKYTTEELSTMADELQTEHEGLMQEKKRLDRMGQTITEQMTKDAQELLQMFGIPYIVAPTEAEAQCAFLESVNLTDGTITDDSDIWLFGGKTVYKNFFDQKKHVVQFLAERIEKCFNLTREQLILLALLVGSDYTTGISGVGPVTAMEILAAFSVSRRDLLALQTATSVQAKCTTLVKGLAEFKQWVRSGRRTDDTSLRKKLRNVKVTDDFPSIRVVQAYMEPKIDNNKDKFTWGQPDVTTLRDFAKKKFGWSQNKFDEILNPVLKRMQDRKNQKTVQDYFKRKIEFHSLEDKMSKRVKAAVTKMNPDGVVGDVEPPKKVQRKRKAAVTINTEKDVEESVNVETVDEIAFINEINKPSTSRSKESIVKTIEVCTENPATSAIDIVVSKLERYQEIIPQREKDKFNVLQNKLKAIEVFRMANLDKKKGSKKKKIARKEQAKLSESSDSD